MALNANLVVDAQVGALAYAGASVQVLGIAHLAAPTRGFPVAAQGFGGVAVPLAEGETWRLTLDVVADLGVVSLNDATLVTIGVLAGPRFVHRSGFTLAAKLPAFGYAGSPQASRGGVLYFYLASLIAAPLLSLGCSF